MVSLALFEKTSRQLISIQSFFILFFIFINFLSYKGIILVHAWIDRSRETSIVESIVTLKKSFFYYLFKTFTYLQQYFSVTLQKMRIKLNTYYLVIYN